MVLSTELHFTKLNCGNDLGNSDREQSLVLKLDQRLTTFSCSVF